MIYNNIDQKWYWSTDCERFINTNNLAFTSYIDTTPYYHAVPSGYQPFRGLFRLIGIRDHFTSLDYVNLLTFLAKKHSKNNSSNNPNNSLNISMGSPDNPGDKSRDYTATASVDSSGYQLSKRDLNMCIQVVQYLSDDTNMRDIHSHIYIPDEHSTLSLAPNLVYDDAPWLNNPNNPNNPDNPEKSEGSEYIFVHPKLSNNVSKKLGAKSLKLKLLNLNSELLSLQNNQNNFGGNHENLKSNFGGKLEAFGQSESLTRRLKNILNLYPEGY